MTTKQSEASEYHTVPPAHQSHLVCSTRGQLSKRIVGSKKKEDRIVMLTSARSETLD
jgi:hypothetical protein